MDQGFDNHRDAHGYLLAAAQTAWPLPLFVVARGVPPLARTPGLRPTDAIRAVRHRAPMFVSSGGPGSLKHVGPQVFPMLFQVSH
jgi:hypothetical protein